MSALYPCWPLDTGFQRYQCIAMTLISDYCSTDKCAVQHHPLCPPLCLQKVKTNYLSGCRDPLVALHTRNSHLNSSPFLLNKEFLLWIYNCNCNSSSSFTILPSMDKKIVSQRPLRTNFYFRHSVCVNSLHFRVRPRFSSKQARKAPSYASSKL